MSFPLPCNSTFDVCRFFFRFSSNRYHFQSTSIRPRHSTCINSLRVGKFAFVSINNVNFCTYELFNSLGDLFELGLLIYGAFGRRFIKRATVAASSFTDAPLNANYLSNEIKLNTKKKSSCAISLFSLSEQKFIAFFRAK